MGTSTAISAGMSISYNIGVPLVLMTAPPNIVYSPPSGYTFHWASPAISGGNAEYSKEKDIWTFNDNSTMTAGIVVGFPDAGYSWRVYITATHTDSGMTYSFNDQLGNGGSSTSSTVTTSRTLTGQRHWVFKSSLRMTPPGAYPPRITKRLEKIRGYAKNT
jgi:hypothetical protein